MSMRSLRLVASEPKLPFLMTAFENAVEVAMVSVASPLLPVHVLLADEVGEESHTFCTMSCQHLFSAVRSWMTALVIAFAICCCASLYDCSQLSIWLRFVRAVLMTLVARLPTCCCTAWS